MGRPNGGLHRVKLQLWLIAAACLAALALVPSCQAGSVGQLCVQANYRAWQVVSLSLETASASMRCLGVRGADGSVITAQHCILPGLGSTIVVSNCEHGTLRYRSRVHPQRDLAVLVPADDQAKTPQPAPAPLATVGTGPPGASASYRAVFRRGAHLSLNTPASVRPHGHRLLVRFADGAPGRGDSGGPLFVQHGEALQLSGVLSAGTPQSAFYESLDHSVRVWLAWALNPASS